MGRNDHWHEDFDRPIARYNAAVAGGDPDEIAAARADYPTLQEEIANHIGDLDEAEADPVQQAALERALQAARELRGEQAARRREREKARQRTRNRAVRLSRTVELPTKCVRCGAKLDPPKTTGRPRLYCSSTCRKGAYENRRARRDGAVQVRLIEKVVTEHVAHSGTECLHAVLHSAKSWDGVIEGLV